MDTYTIDVTNKKLGRAATDIARALMGKDKPSYTPNAIPDFAITVTGAGSLDISDKKGDTKIYKHYTGYPGGLRENSLNKVVAKKGNGEILRIAVRGMLPSNKLRAKRMKLLTIEE